jgi:predicted N-acetyltransferase YhbS
VTELRIRPFEVTDATALTRLLHRAYAELGAAGLNFTAVDQSEATTIHRASGGLCLVAEDVGEVVGSVTISLPPSATMRSMFAPADAADVAWLTQLGVDPARRDQGIARRLWLTGLEWARANAATTIGVDTAIPATHLIDLYERWGFTRAGTVHWEGKTYDSEVLLQRVA